MNSQKYSKELYPEDFTEEDKLKFDYYFEQSKLMFPTLYNDQWLLKMGIIACMRKEKNGNNEPPTEEEIAAIKNQYISKETVYYYSEPKETIEKSE